MTVAFKSDFLDMHHAAPTLVYAYGAYGHSLDISYAPEYDLLLEQGFIIAFAHVRGGGELGRRCISSNPCSSPLCRLIVDIIGCSLAHAQSIQLLHQALISLHKNLPFRLPIPLLKLGVLLASQ